MYDDIEAQICFLTIHYTVHFMFIDLLPFRLTDHNSAHQNLCL